MAPLGLRLKSLPPESSFKPKRKCPPILNGHRSRESLESSGDLLRLSWNIVTIISQLALLSLRVLAGG